MVHDLSRRRMMALGSAAAAVGALPLSVGAAAGASGAPRSGIQEVVVSVFEPAFLADALVATGDFLRVPLPDAPREQWAAWRLPDGCTRIEQVLLRHTSSPGGSGSLRLVKFHGVEQKVMRSSQRSWDTGGIFDVDVYVKDADAVYRLLQRHGWSALGEPVEYTEANFHVWQSVAQGPNGFMFAMIQRISPPISAPSFKMVSPIFNSTQMVADLGRAIDFYTRILGWKLDARFDITDQAEPGADVLGLPQPQAQTAVRRLAMLRSHDGEAPAHIELIENSSMHGRDFSAQCVAPNVGILTLRMPVPDAAAYAAAIRMRGGTIFAEPRRLTIAPYGAVTSFGILSPEGALLEFYSER